MRYLIFPVVLWLMFFFYLLMNVRKPSKELIFEFIKASALSTSIVSLVVFIIVYFFN